jgi:hypothetical protein
MNKCVWLRLTALLLLVMVMVSLAACGGGDSTTTPVIGGNIDDGSGNVPPLDIDGSTQYPGQDLPDQPDLPDNNGGGGVPSPGNFNFGDSIFTVPLDTNGVGKLVVTSGSDTQRLGFAPGQQVAFVIVNLNPLYLDVHADAAGNYPVIPQSNFTVSADLVQKGLSSSYIPQNVSTTDELGSLANYQGMERTWERQSPTALYERLAEANGYVPYAAEQPEKSTSAIQLGELRTFIAVPATIQRPPVEPGPESPERDTTEFRYPRLYNSQWGRLVAIGAHCLVFLSTEINDGHPDTIQFTPARLNRMAREFDTKIFPRATAAFGEVRDYNDWSIWKDVDRSIILTGDDFDTSGNLMINMPGSVDADIANEKKIVIFINNGGSGGFYTWFQPDSDIWQELMEDGYSEETITQMLGTGSTLYIAGDNYPANDDIWDAAFSIMAHEFQHKLYHDHDMPERNAPYTWFNEGLAMLSIHVCGYTVNSGKIIDWAIDGQLTTYLEHVNLAGVPYDGSNELYARYPWMNQAQYGNGFLFMLYLYEHYGSNLGKKMYDKAATGETNLIKLIESATGENFSQTYCKFALANFIDGIYSFNDPDPNDDTPSGIFDPRFHYTTIDLRGTVNLPSGTIVLPGVKTQVYPAGGSYPVTDIDRPVNPWCMDYLVFTNGDGRDLEVTFYTDPGFRAFLLPADYSTAQNAALITPGVTMNY